MFGLKSASRIRFTIPALSMLTLSLALVAGAACGGAETPAATAPAPPSLSELQSRLRAAFTVAGIAAAAAKAEPDFTENAHAVLNRRYLKKWSSVVWRDFSSAP